MADIRDANHRRPRQFRRVDRQITDFDEEELRRRYRFSTTNIDKLVELIGHRLQRRTRRNEPLTPRQQIMIALRFYASGNFLQIIGDTFGVDVATVSRVVTAVTDALFVLKDRTIRFPTSTDELKEAQTVFYSFRGMPCVIGCLDGTHVKILSPGGEQERSYVNRKHQHTINVQATCDHKGRFSSINAAWPGSCHDAHVFRVSDLCRHMEENHQDYQRGVLLGDSGYPCRPFLMTPYLNPVTDAEVRFNTAHTGTRNLIERVFGMWKRKFHVLHSEIRMKPAKCSKIIVVCAILYNLALLWKEPDVVDDVVDEQPAADTYNGQMDGRGVRAHIATAYFS